MYKLDKDITAEDVESILQGLKNTMSERTRYNNSKGITDIGSGLKRFLEYAHSDYRKKLADTVLSEEKNILENSMLSVTEREELVKSRIGQGLFRQKLIAYWGGCSVTKCSNFPLLMASHIRPWRKSDSQERLDVYNGLLLTPNLDKLFDKGYISFNRKGKIICSDGLAESDRRILGVDSAIHLVKIEDAHQKYLKYHRDYCLL